MSLTIMCPYFKNVIKWEKKAHLRIDEMWDPSVSYIILLFSPKNMFGILFSVGTKTTSLFKKKWLYSNPSCG